MKTIVFMRHAKAEVIKLEKSDFERKLTDKGKNDAQNAAKSLLKDIHKIDLIITSSAKRTFKTAKIVAEEFDIDKKEILCFDELYEAEHNEYLKVIRSIDDTNINTVLVVGHNPTILAIADAMSSFLFDDFKPGAYVVFNIPIETFKMFVLGPANLLHSYTP